MTGGDGVRQLGESLDRVVAGLASPAGRSATAGGPAPAGVASLFGRWEPLVGADIAAHARPVGVEDGVLIVAVDDPAWGAELRWLSGELLERIVAAGGPRLEGLKVRVRLR